MVPWQYVSAYGHPGALRAALSYIGGNGGMQYPPSTAGRGNYDVEPLVVSGSPSLTGSPFRVGSPRHLAGLYRQQTTCHDSQDILNCPTYCSLKCKIKCINILCPKYSCQFTSFELVRMCIYCAHVDFKTKYQL